MEGAGRAETNAPAMRRLSILALLALASFASPAAAQTTDVTSSCAETDDMTLTAAASGADSGGTPAEPVGDGTGSGGAPAGYDSSTSNSATGDVPTGSGDTSLGSDTVGAVPSQEPEPEPEGPGEEQPGDPQTPEIPEIPETPGGEEQLGEETGGGLPRTGLEVLQLGLLGLVLVLVGARLRAIALRRKRRAAEPEPAPTPAAPPATVAAVRHAEETEEWDVEPHVSRGEDYYYDEPDADWPFPDPAEPAPTGLLPSTAGARRQARAAAERD